jgi:hypothetical protein
MGEEAHPCIMHGSLQRTMPVATDGALVAAPSIFRALNSQPALHPTSKATQKIN